MATSRRAVAAALKQVIDPEVDINIVDLGLVYDIQIDDSTVRLALTMTTLACQMSSYIKQQVASVLDGLPDVERAQINFVWEPTWSTRMIEPETRERHFGPLRRSPSSTLSHPLPAS